MMYMNNLLFTVATTFTFASPFSYNPQLYCPDCLSIIARPADFIFNSTPILIRASTATCLFVGTREHERTAYYAGRLLSTRNSVANTTAIYFAFILLNLHRPSVNFLATN